MGYADLVEGIESPFGLELLATNNWLESEHPQAREAEIVGHTYAWNDRKMQFSEPQIRDRAA